MKILRLNLLIILVCFSSCTIHKRLYRPGWDVSFRGKLLTNKTENDLNDLTSSDAITVEAISHVRLDSINSVPSVKHASVQANGLIKCVEQTSIQSKGISSIPKRDRSFKQMKRAVLSDFQQKKSFREHTDSTKTLNTIVMILLLVGLLILLLGLLIFLSADAGISGVVLTFIGAIGIVFGSIMMLVCLIILLVSLLTKGVIKNEQRLKEPSNDAQSNSEKNVENKVDLRPNETANESKKVENNTTKKSMNWIIVGGATLLFALIFLGIRHV